MSAPAGTGAGGDRATRSPGTARVPVAIAIACRDEEALVPYLAASVRALERELAGAYALEFVFVDDGSCDETWDLLRKQFGSRPDCRILRHEEPRGLAAAIRTGIEGARAGIVAALDVEREFDPRLLAAMIPRILDGADAVLASPFLAPGAVRNVPAWRIALSRALAGAYCLAAHHDLSTWTSGLRVYRRSAVVDLPAREAGDVGLSETLCLLARRGARIEECPAVLERRSVGRRHRYPLERIAGHARLLLRIAATRWQS